MKIPAQLLLFATLLLSPVLHAQTADRMDVEKEGVGLNVPKDWTARETKDPILHVLEDPTNRFSVVVLREVKADMGVEDLQEYFEFKLEKIAGSWESPQLKTSRPGQVNGNSVLWTEGTADLVDPQGITIPSKVLFATVEGKDYYYLVLMSERFKGSTPGRSIFPEMLMSFKAP